MKKKDYFKLWLLSFATWGCLIPLRGYYVGLYGATIILTIAFALLTWWAMKIRSKGRLLASANPLACPLAVCRVGI